MRSLTSQDREQAFIRVTRLFPERYAEQIAAGMSDCELQSALKDYLGIAGGSGARDTLCVAYQGAGLKIWAGWSFPNSALDEPVFASDSTIKMARQVYNIADPDNDQLALF